MRRKWDAINLPGNFLVLKDAFVIIDLEMETVDGVMATLMPMGPSHGWPGIMEKRETELEWPFGIRIQLRRCLPDGFACNEFLIAFVTNITSAYNS